MKIIIFTLLLFCSSCSLINLKIHNEKLSDYLPRETEVPGWRIEYKSDIIEEDEVKLGAIKKISGRYSSYSDNNISISVVIIKFLSPLDAFGCFTIDKGADVKIDDKDFYSTSKGIFSRKGEYYIKIFTKNNTEFPYDFNLFYKTVADNIKKINDESLPGSMSLFSIDKINRNNIIYYKNDSDKIIGLEKYFLRKRKFFNTEKSIFFHKSKSLNIAEKKYMNLVNNEENKFTIIENGKIKIAFKRIGDVEYVFIALYNNWIYGIFDSINIKEGSLIISELKNEILDIEK